MRWVVQPWRGDEVAGGSCAGRRLEREHLRSPLLVDGRALPTARAGRVGADADEILSELGFTVDDVRRLRRDGVLGSVMSWTDGETMTISYHTNGERRVSCTHGDCGAGRQGRTGHRAGQGVGRQIASDAASVGAAVVIVNDLSFPSARRRSAEVVSWGRRVRTAFDVTKLAAVGGGLRTVKENFGHLHALVNNAGNAGRGGTAALSASGRTPRRTGRWLGTTCSGSSTVSGTESAHA